MTLPLSATPSSVVVSDMNNTQGDGNHIISTVGYVSGKFTVYSNGTGSIYGHYIAICS